MGLGASDVLLDAELLSKKGWFILCGERPNSVEIEHDISGQHHDTLAAWYAT